MNFNALVMARSASGTKTLVAAFAELGIEFRVSTSASETIEMLAASYHSAVIVDFDMPQALRVAKMVRALEPKRRPIVFGMLGSQTSIAGVFQAGTNFVLYKPLDLRQVLHAFRAAQGFMRPDRRQRSRLKSEALAYLHFLNGTVPALVLDVTEQGLSVQAAEALVPMRGVRLRFILPGSAQFITATGDFIWADASGRAGLFFRELAPGARRNLDAWLRRREAKRSESVHSLPEPQPPRPASSAH